MSASSRVTILIPNLNGEIFLRAALDSCIRQTYKPLIIVVDNGSRDASLEILQEYASEYSYLTFFSYPIRGISNALNYGLSKVSSEFIARLDSDDYMEADRIEIQLKFMDRNSSTHVVGSQVSFIDSDGLRNGESRYPLNSDTVKSALAYMNPLAHPSVMIRTSALKNVGGYRPIYDGAEDYDLWLRMSEFGEISNLPETLTNYRQHSEQTSQQNNLAFNEFTARLGSLSRILKRRDLNGLFKFLYITRLIDLLFVRQEITFHRKLFRYLRK